MRISTEDKIKILTQKKCCMFTSCLAIFCKDSLTRHSFCNNADADSRSHHFADPTVGKLEEATGRAPCLVQPEGKVQLTLPPHGQWGKASISRRVPACLGFSAY
uniref:Uncharacterized protein n=1 Tax=Falco tinnunculus TaxID=100819 RepID=A0A8C4XLX6_FALTI